ncbi:MULTISPECIES: (deoxy)nucleoside triphosphate pyrophosphohydrolase [unclassified Nonomuraea]|uniref:(deoxy)nucleoside triphosphate pyrophosphohydrolase n=1 Tax=Nonomuraea sp. NPDC003804 TaxID=3154547 RepID=UPI0033A383A1
MAVLVVGAAIIADGRLLAAQRAEPPELAGGWEFPGGKVDEGENDIDALVRECHEELGVIIRVGERVGGDWPLGDDYVMRVWLASLVSGTPQTKEHLALRWLAPEEFYDVPWLAADLPVVKVVETLLRED